MATAGLTRTTSLSGTGTPALSRTRGILLETMQLVEPVKHLPVPNHLLESKIYSKVAQNSVVQARPAVIHFGGFELGRTQRQVLRLANVSTEVQRMHIIPPQTSYFYVKYTKNDRLVPGLTLDCTIEFTPDEWRYYYDCIRVHCRGEENLVIPIHAYPVMNTSEFPQQVDFPPVPVGCSHSHVLPLRCHAPIDFEFQLSVLQPHPAFIVDPMAGVVPANGEVDLKVTFSPSEFSTAHMKLQLTISQFNAKPLICTFTGTSAPGLAKEISDETAIEYAAYSSSVLDPRAISPLDRARKKRRQRSDKSTRQGQPAALKPQEIEYAGIKFPANLDTPHAVAQVLSQEPGKLRMSDLRDAVLSKKGKSGAQTRQMKEAVFEVAVRKDVYEERQNQLRWQVKLGDNQVTPDERIKISDERDFALVEYKTKRGDPVEEDEQHRSCTQCTMRRTRRDATQVAEETAKFDMYTNNLWASRHCALNRFQQAARKVVLQLRVEKRLQLLRQTLLKKGGPVFPSTTDEPEKSDDKQSEDVDNILLTADRVTSVKFPTYVSPDVKDDMAVDALGPVPVKPTEVIIRTHVPYHDLKVPLQYELMGYQPHSVQDSSVNYVTPNLVRPLRTGAEDEIINLPMAKLPEKPQTPLVNEGDMRVEEYVDAPTPGPGPAPVVPAEPLTPPQALFRPIDYPALHIFNPAPGIQVFQPPLPYAETDSDFHLCPLPRYRSRDPTNPHGATQKRYLDREDVIRGAMSWKRFPSQGLTSLANTPTLTNVWVPRWNDTFGSELLPPDVPELYDALPEDDLAIIQEDSVEEQTDQLPEEPEEGASIQLTPQMVNAQFALIDPRATTPDDQQKKEDMFPEGSKMPATNIPVSHTGPVPREKREQELDYFMRKKYNRLGSKMQNHVDTLDSLKTNPDMILK